MHRPAKAMIEFCPATFNYQAVGQSEEARTPAALYGFELSALGPRTITTATLAFDTDAGWFTVDVPGVTLIRKARHYSEPYISFVRHDYVSPIFYARFPKPVTVVRAWVLSASAQGDSLFSWGQEGTVRCDPGTQQLRLITAKDIKPIAHGERYRPVLPELDPNDRDTLSASPPPVALVVDARQSKSLENASCIQPFQDGMVVSQATPTYPDAMRYYNVSGRVTVVVEVAIGADGKLADAWVWGPSGYKAFNDETLRAARSSTYEAARAYCQAVPSEYFFSVTFDPNG
jgi:TonB family protein